MATQSYDERLSAVENELSQLKMQINTAKPTQADAPWWQEWFGAFKDDPDFDAAMERGAAYRRSQPTADEASEKYLS